MDGTKVYYGALRVINFPDKANKISWLIEILHFWRNYPFKSYYYGYYDDTLCKKGTVQ